MRENSYNSVFNDWMFDYFLVRSNDYLESVTKIQTVLKKIEVNNLYVTCYLSYLSFRGADRRCLLSLDRAKQVASPC